MAVSGAPFSFESGPAGYAGEEPGPVSSAVEGFFEDLGRSSRRLAQAAERFAAESLQAGERLRDEMVSRMQEAMERLEASVHAGQEAARLAQEAARSAQEAAARAGEHAEQAVAGRQIQSASTEDVWQQLGSDYERLTTLVNELHSRIAGLSAPQPPAEPQAPEATLSPEVAPEAAGEVEATAGTPEAQAIGPAAPETSAAPTGVDGIAAAWEHPSAAGEGLPAEAHAEQPVVEAEPAATEGEEEVAAVEPVPESGEQAVAVPPVELSGRILVTLAPVPDFDLLLKIDAALGRMDTVGNVSLADYVREVASFRVQLRRPQAASDFATALVQAGGLRLSLGSASENEVRFSVG
jgi:hypothetical protein